MRKTLGFPSRSDANRSVQPQMARGLNFAFRKQRDCTSCIYVVKTKVLVSCAVTAQLISPLFSHILVGRNISAIIR